MEPQVDREANMFAIARLEELHKEVVAFKHRQETPVPGSGETKFDHFLLARWAGQVSSHFISLIRAYDATAILFLREFMDIVGLIENESYWVLKNWSRNARQAVDTA